MQCSICLKRPAGPRDVCQRCNRFLRDYVLSHKVQKGEITEEKINLLQRELDVSVLRAKFLLSGQSKDKYEAYQRAHTESEKINA